MNKKFIKKTNNNKTLINSQVKNNADNKELGSSARELLKPENLMGPYKTVEELMKNTWDVKD